MSISAYKDTVEITEEELVIILDALLDSFVKVRASCSTITDTLASKIDGLRDRLVYPQGDNVKHIVKHIKIVKELQDE